MKYKVGDKVKVIRNAPGTVYTNKLGDICEVRKVYINNKMYWLSNDFWYGEEDLGSAEDPLVTKIQERNNKPPKLEEHDPIKPAHYHKGEMDLFEAWSKIYPANEYRAIMQAISMRYMFRDKDDRVEDVQEAIETLERLKEFEEGVE